MNCYFCGNNIAKLKDYGCYGYNVHCKQCNVIFFIYDKELSYIQMICGDIVMFTVLKSQDGWGQYYELGESRIGSYKIEDYYFCNNTPHQAMEKIKMYKVFL